MAKKKDDKTIDKSRQITMMDQPGKSRDRLISELAASGLASNAKTMVNFSADTYGEMSLTDSIDVLKDAGKTVNAGDLAAMERLLTAQVIALDSIFCSMANRAKMNVGHYPETVSKYMNLALRAQSQCRSTVEALAEIKNPRPLAFIKQQNVGENVQVNNQATSPSRTEEKPKYSNGLLEDKRDEKQWLDTGAPEKAGGKDPKLETVGEKHRTED